MGRMGSVQRIEKFTGVLFRLGFLTPEEEQEIREKIEQLKGQNRSR
ncbi:hypothetical protein [Ammoniphilus sp. CFH 90114]|nr:hypothetical protein [Ammoniphilus sp. CFH 90114]